MAKLYKFANSTKKQPPDQTYAENIFSVESTANLTRKKGKDLVKIFFLIGVSWTVVLIGLAFWGITTQHQATDNMTLYQARSSFQQIVLTRFWNAQHGRVYVPITEKTPPNPYLNVPDRDLTTINGQRLTMVNPAYMTRQISELASERGYFRFHITSLKPVRPENKPSEWEIAALKSFTRTNPEFYGWTEDSTGSPVSFRYMAPLWTEEPCLKCHQGHRVGDLRGGISVTIPADALISYRNAHIGSIIAAYFSIWVLGIFGISVAFLYARQDQIELGRLLLKLQRALNEVKTLKGLIPICSHCKKIRTDQGYWEKIEKYLRENSEAKFTHGICPQCAENYMAELDKSS